MTSTEQGQTASHSRADESVWPRRLRWSVMLLGAFNFAWAARRMLFVFSNWDPNAMPVITSGCEEEALFSIWKFTRGEPVYSDPSALPYAVSYFNWLFYFVYGTLTNFCLWAFSLADGWIPVITRCITLGIVTASAGVTSAIIQEAKLLPANWGRTSRLALLSLFYCNDLFGDWITTTRPDLGALLGDLAGLWFALRYFRHGKPLALGAAVLCFYAAWAFKYNFVAALAAVCLTLLFTRRHREVILVALAFSFLCAFTLGVGNPLYRLSILSLAGNSTYSLEQGWWVWSNVFDFAPHMAVVVAALAGTFLFRRCIPWEPNRLLLIFSCALSWAIMSSGATKHGADYNYFFEPSVLGLLWLLSLREMPVPKCAAVRWLRMALPVALFAMAAVAAQNAFVAAARWRSQAKAEQALTERQRRAALKERAEWDVLRVSLAALPGPILVADRRYNLPWVQPHPPHFVVAYNYALDRKRGRIFEQGGLAGLIREGYFKTIVTPVIPSTNEHVTVAGIATKHGIDGQRLDGYSLHHADRHFEYYLLRSHSGGEQFSSR